MSDRVQRSVSPVEPIAITGIGCRFAGARGPQEFWQIVRDGQCTVREVPEHRIGLGYDIDHFYDPIPKRAGRVASRMAGFVDHPELFDPTAFGLSPRDAVSMEPQQRLVIEVAFDALDDAGLRPESIRGERVAVMIGHMAEDYSRERIAVLGEEQVNRGLDVFTVAGMSRAVLSGRLSYLLDVTGPSLTLDTACSSSLIATHLACQSIWEGESKFAIAGGVNVFLTPEGNIALSRSGMLAVDGRCKAFDAGADGFVRAEGAGVVVMRPLRDALESGDRIHAVIRGSGISTDGRDGGHMMAPGRQGQAQAMRDAYARAGVSPNEVDYVETHGTGTVIGDPVEIGALADVMGPGRPADRPLLVASVKGNIGHAESASGVAGLIKTALCLRHRHLPAQLHFETPSPLIPWDEIPVRVVAEAIEWPEGRRGLAGVNSFGISGTNAHVVLEAPPPSEAAAARPRASASPYLVPLTAHTERALADVAELQREQCLSPDAPPIEDLTHTLGCRRRQHAERIAVVADSAESLADELAGFVTGQASGALARGSVRQPPPSVVFVFSGQGGQWLGMGRELLQCEPRFRRSIEAWDDAFSSHVDWSLLSVIRGSVGAPALERLDVLQPTLIALQSAIANVWMGWGVEPTAVVGQSMGEISAAHIAGVLDLGDAARIACERGRQVQRVAGRGAMAVVGLPASALSARLVGEAGCVEISGETSPNSTVISGDDDAVRRTVRDLEDDGVFARVLAVDFASHCFHMDPLLDAFSDSIRDIAPANGSLPFYSTVTGKSMAGRDLDAEYWVRNLREPVRLMQGVNEAMSAGGGLFVECSPHPTLGRPIGEIAAAGEHAVAHVPSLHRDKPERRALLVGLAELFTRGVEVDFSELTPGGKVAELPLYPYQRERYWFGQRTRLDQRRPRHPMLTTRLSSSIDENVEHWEMTLDADALPWLSAHRLDGRVTAPVSLALDLATAVTRECWPEVHMEVCDLELVQPLEPAEGGRRTLQTVMRRQPGGRAEIRVSSRAEGERAGAWIQHARCTVRPAVCAPGETLSLEALKQRCSDERVPEQHHQNLAAGGLELGRELRCVKRLATGQGEVLARLSLPRQTDSEWNVHALHPALCAAAVQLAGISTNEDEELAEQSGGPLLPLRVQRFSLEPDVEIEGEVWCHVSRRPSAPGGRGDLVEADLLFYAADGRLAARMTHLAAKQRTRREKDDARDCELAPRAAADRNFVARVVAPDRLDPVALIEQDRAAPGPGEVEIEVEHVSLSFSDVRAAMGMGADRAGQDEPLGREVAGRIVRVGDDVDPARTGDEVFGFASPALARHVVTPAAFVATRPPHVDARQAASVPLPWAMALYGLRDLARVRAGERVLVTLAPAGDGLAAIEIADRLGARVLALARDERERAWLVHRGVAHVFDLTGAGIGEAVHRATDGAGVDVIYGASPGDQTLNSAVDQLCQGGRLIEVHSDGGESTLGRHSHGVRDNRTHHRIDFDSLMRLRKEHVASLLGEVAGWLDSAHGALGPCTHFDVEQVNRAIRYATQVRSMGRVVLDFSTASMTPIHPARVAHRLGWSGEWPQVEGGVARPGVGSDGASTGPAAQRGALVALPRQERISRLREVIGDAIGAVLSLGISERNRLDTTARFDDLGLDSLMTLELFISLGDDLEVELDVANAGHVRSIADLAPVLADALDTEKVSHG